MLAVSVYSDFWHNCTQFRLPSLRFRFFPPVRFAFHAIRFTFDDGVYALDKCQNATVKSDNFHFGLCLCCVYYVNGWEIAWRRSVALAKSWRWITYFGGRERMSYCFYLHMRLASANKLSTLRAARASKMTRNMHTCCGEEKRKHNYNLLRWTCFGVMFAGMTAVVWGTFTVPVECKLIAFDWFSEVKRNTIWKYLRWLKRIWSSLIFSSLITASWFQISFLCHERGQKMEKLGWKGNKW